MTDWTLETIPTTTWRSVTYGNGLFVAVAGSGTNRVMTSPDGTTWTPRSVPEANIWISVTYGNGLFVAVAFIGTNRVMTSPDGETWTARSAAEANSWISVTYGNGLFVAVASDGTNRVMTSPDGIIWTSRTSAANHSWNSVTYGNGLFVAVSSTGTGNRVMTSPDGIIWTSRTSAGDNTWNSVTYGNGLFVAVSSTGTGNRVMTSPDGNTWTSRTSAANNTWTSVTYRNGLFVAVASDGTNRVMTSPDGISWTARSTASAQASWQSVIYGEGNGLFVAVGSKGAIMTGSINGINKSLYPVLFNTTTSKYGLLAGSSGITGSGSVTVKGGVYGTSGSIVATVNGTVGSNTSQALIELSSLITAINGLSNTGGNYDGGNFTFTPNVYDTSGLGSVNVTNVTFEATTSTDQFIIRNSTGGFNFGPSTTFTFSGPVNVDNIFWVTSTTGSVNMNAVSQVKGIMVSQGTLFSGASSVTIDGQVFATQQIDINSTLNTIDVPLCYLKGTKILTDQGYVAIEHIRKGDRVVTAGKIIDHKTVVKEEPAIDTVVWCGKIPSTVKHAPICIKANAIGPAVPFEDLWVSPGHGIVLKDQLEFVQHHLKSETIFQDQDAPTDEYYHVKLSSHQVIYANGLASESLNFNIEDYLG